MYIHVEIEALYWSELWLLSPWHGGCRHVRLGHVSLGWRQGWGRGGWRCLETDRRVLIKTPGIFNYTHWLASNQGNTDTLTHRNIEKKPFKKYIINRFTDPRVGDCKIFICDFCPCHLTSWIWVEQDTRYTELDDGGEPSSDSANLKIWNWNIRQILVEITAI